MVSTRKVKLAAEMEPESAKSSSITQPRKTERAEELQAKIDQFLERDRLIIEGKVPLVLSDNEDSDDEELTDSSGPKAEKVNVRSIMQGFCQDSAFYRSASHRCEWIGCQFQSGKQRKFMVHVERHARKVDRDEDGYVCQWQLCDFSAETQDDFVGHLHYHAFHTKLKVFGARLIASVKLPVCTFGSDNRNKIPNETNYECAWSDCGMRFNKIMDFGLHLDCHYSDLYADCPRGKKKPFTCQWLGCKFTHRDVHQAKVHGQKHTGPRYIACDNCGHTFIRRRLLVMHCLHAPTEPKPKTPKYKCDEYGCGKEFYRITAYEAHYRTHCNRPLTDYDCPICKKSFFSKTWFSKHLEAKHNGSANNTEEHKKNVARSVRRRKIFSEEDTSDEDSSDEGSTDDEPAGGKPKQTVSVQAEPKEARYPSRKSGNGITSVNHRRSTTNEEETSEDDRTVEVISVKAEPKEARSPSCTSRNVISSLNCGTTKHREIVERGVKRRRSTSSEEDTSEDDSPVEVISLKAEPKEARDSSPRKRTCKTLLDYFSSAKSVNHATPERREIGARSEKRRKSEAEMLSV
ncbi:RE1-silencing transcription factor-like [Anopheles aquasalis]|uniref:RE1-silencing transcription factor-like n=1 Tax=Anopheles aquasalis TaxID=42839 RepID=UPI00215B145B|nr:RE1-silencing transcription factor-like [Anopheles aquasalis]